MLKAYVISPKFQPGDSETQQSQRVPVRSRDVERLPVCRLGHSAVEGARLFEDGDEVAEAGGAGRRIEAAVLVHEPLQRVEEPQAPSRVGRTGDVRASTVSSWVLG